MNTGNNNNLGFLNTDNNFAKLEIKESVFKKEKEDTPEYENKNERKSLK